MLPSRLTANVRKHAKIWWKRQCGLVENFACFPAVKSCENRLKFYEVRADYETKVFLRHVVANVCLLGRIQCMSCGLLRPTFPWCVVSVSHFVY